MKKGVLASLFVFGFVLLMGFGSAATINVTGCGTLTDNNIYTLNQSITPTTSPSYCLLVSGNNVTIDGAGYNISNSTYNGAAIWINSARSNITIKNIILWGGSGVTYPCGVYIYGGSNNVTISNVTFLGSKYQLQITNTGGVTSGVTVNNCTFDGTSLATNGFGILVSQGATTPTNLVFNNSVFQNFNFSSASGITAINLQNNATSRPDNLTISNNVFTNLGSNDAVYNYWVNFGCSFMSNVLIENNTLYNGNTVLSYGFSTGSISSCVGYTATNWTFKNNLFLTEGTKNPFSIYLAAKTVGDGISSLTIFNNSFGNGGVYRGKVATSNLTNVNISYNKMFISDYSASSYDPYIELFAYSNNSIISNNEFGNSSWYANTAPYGTFVQVDNPQGTLVENNTLYMGNISNGITLTAKNYNNFNPIVRNNTIYSNNINSSHGITIGEEGDMVGGNITNGIIENNTLYLSPGTLSSNVLHGILFGYNINGTVRYNKIYGGAHGIVVKGNDAAEVYGNEVYNTSLSSIYDKGGWNQLFYDNIIDVRNGGSADSIIRLSRNNADDRHSINSTWRDNTVYSTKGIVFSIDDKVDNATFSGFSISSTTSSGKSVTLNNLTTGILIRDASFNQNISATVNSTITLLNVSGYPIANETVDSTSSITRKWYYNAVVNDTNGNILNGANVSIYNSSGSLVGSYLTNSSGMISQLNLTEYVNNGTRSYATNYTINVTMEDYSNYSAQVNLTTNVNSVLTMSESVVPNVTLVSPVDDYSDTSSSVSVSFKFNVSDDSEVSNCTLYLSSTGYANTSAISKTETNTISRTLTPGSYSWYVNCTDALGNVGNSSTRSLTITAPVVASNPSSGGSTFSASETSLKNGYTQKLVIGWKVSFKSAGASHQLKLNKVTSDQANITVSSTPQNFLLKVGEEKKVDLNSDGNLDLLVKLNSVGYNVANVTLKNINEKVSSTNPPANEVKTSEDKENEETETSEVSEESERSYLWVVVVGLVVALAIILFLKIGKRRKHFYWKVNVKKVHSFY